MKNHILIADQDGEDRSMLENFLCMLGYKVTIEEDGDKVLALAAEILPDLLLLSVNLRGTPGILILKELKENPVHASLPVLLLSETNEEELSIIGLSSGATEFIHKPIQIAEVTLKVQNALELRNARKELERLNHQLEKEKNLLSRYFSEDLVQKILDEEISPNLGGSRICVTTMFFDLRNSTGMSEGMQPDEFAGMLSCLFSSVMDSIFRHNGSVNKLLGDGVMATFGAPIPSENDALNAVQCALEIQKLMQTQTHGGTPLSAGIGIATGEVFAGNVGSSRRMEYTVLGDSVNLAARLEKLTKKLEHSILMDKTTWEKTRGETQGGYVNSMQVRGQSSITEIYTAR